MSPAKPMTEDREPRTEPESPCWFCHRVVPVSALIAGYDTWDEQRLACLACNEVMMPALDAAREQAATEARRGLLAKLRTQTHDLLRGSEDPASWGVQPDYAAGWTAAVHSAELLIEDLSRG